MHRRVLISLVQFLLQLVLGDDAELVANAVRLAGTAGPFCVLAGVGVLWDGGGREGREGGREGRKVSVSSQEGLHAYCTTTMQETFLIVSVAVMGGT